MALGEFENYVVPPDSVFMEYEGAAVKQEAERALLNGNKLSLGQLDLERPKGFDDGELLRVYNGKREFKAVYTFVKKENVFKPYKMFL